VRKLSLDQRRVLAEFCANFAVAWLAAGVIAPYVAGISFLEVIKPVAMSVFWAGFLVTLMLFLVKGGKGRRK